MCEGSEYGLLMVNHVLCVSKFECLGDLGRCGWIVFSCIWVFDIHLPMCGNLVLAAADLRFWCSFVIMYVDCGWLHHGWL